MSYSKLLFIAAFLVFGFRTSAQAQPQQVKVTISHATVFLRGAELENTANVSIPQGESEVVLTNIANSLREQSMSIGTSNGVVVQSITFENKPQKTTDLNVVKRMTDSLDMFEYRKKSIEDKLEVAKIQLNIINKKGGTVPTDTSMNNMQVFLKLIDNRMPALLEQQQQYNKQIEDIKKQSDELVKRLATEERRTAGPTVGQLVVKLYSPQATATNIKLMYVTPSAGWSPNYDLRVEKVNQPVQLVYKAKVFQTTGLDWNKVQLTLSTGNPNESAEAPILTAQRLSFAYSPVAYDEVSSLGYAANVQTSFSRTSAKKSIAVASEQVDTKGINNYVQVDNSGINTSFDIDLPYTIPSDGKGYVVNVKTYTVPATYRYYAVPKIEQDVFLQARLTSWGNLNLLPATTNIFYEGYFIGEGRIDPKRSVNDTLNVSLGRDKKIVIRRNQSTDYKASKTFSSNIQQWFGYTIEAQNVKSEQISLTIIDQFPISGEKDITVDDMQAVGAEISKESGAIRWIVDLKPNESRKFDVRYSIKYPKDKSISNL